MDNKQDNVAVESAGETTPQTSSPQVEVPTTEEQITPTQTDQSDKETATDVESATPNDPREHQIKRLAEENRRLKSEKQGSAFDTFRPQPQQSQTVDVGNYTDEYGNVNFNAYNQALVRNAQQVASVQAQQTVQELLDENNARTKHPDLFADAETEKDMAAMWLWEKTQGNNVTVSEIAARFANRKSKDVSKAEKRGAEKMLQEVSEKEQAGLSATSQTSAGARAVQTQEDEAYLSAQTRVGNEDAIVARLSKIPWANK